MDSIDKTDVDLEAAARVTRAFLRDCSRRRQAHDLLEALANLTLERLKQPADERRLTFTAKELVAEVHRLNSMNWPDREGKWVSDQWGKLERLLTGAEQGLRQWAGRLGVQVIPDVDRDKTEGGVGYPTLYWLLPKPVEVPSSTLMDGASLPKQTPEPLVKQSMAMEAGDPAGDLAAELRWDIRYTTESVRGLPKGLAWLRRPWRLEGWRRHAFIWPILSPFVVLVSGFWALASSFWLVLLGQPVAAWLVKWGVWGSLGAGLVIWLLWPWISVIGYRIVCAPWWLSPLSVDEPFLVLGRAQERRVQDPTAPRVFRLVRYSARCPLCGALVTVGKGKGPLRGRLVGRCDESPREHVYSFDHVLMSGRYLYR